MQHREFSRLERAPAYRLVYDAIEKQIFTGTLKVGDPLPAETLLAEQFGVNRSTVREGIRLLVIGGAIGVCASLALTQLLKSLLFDIGPRDPSTLMAVTLLLALVAIAATLIPARAAMHVDPMVALRNE